MSFVDRNVYNRNAVESAAFLTAGAYEYSEAVAAFLTGTRFATV